MNTRFAESERHPSADRRREDAGAGTSKRPCKMVRGWMIPLLLLGTMAYALAEEITLTTYYPSPRGVYQALRVTDDVGIGTMAPGEKIELQASSGKPALRLHKPGVVEYNFGIRSDNSLTIGSARGGGNIDSGRPFILTDTGNVGIGTATPTSSAPGTIRNSLEASGWLLSHGNGGGQLG